MKCPKFLKDNGTVGVCAPSSGFIDNKHIKECKIAKERLEKQGYRVIFSKSCFNNMNGVSNTAKIRAKEFLEMYNSKKIDIIISLSGGEYEMDILDYIDFDELKKHPKLFCGFSDNTILNFLLLTKSEMINVYGHNFYDIAKKHETIDNYIETLKGKILDQHEIKKVSKIDYSYKEKKPTTKYKINYENDWKIYPQNRKTINIKGMLIGGLLDDISIICGTKYDNVQKFINKHKKNGFIWYIDLCTMSLESIKRSLFQLKNANYFEYANCIMFARPIIKKDSFGNDYINVIYDELKDLNIPIIFDTNIGHIAPTYHLVNGKIITLEIKNNKGMIKYEKS